MPNIQVVVAFAFSEKDTLRPGGYIADHRHYIDIAECVG